jgi:hypothetical protein
MKKIKRAGNTLHNAAGLALLVLFLVACEMPSGDSSGNQQPDTPSSDNKTYLKIVNDTDYAVNVYINDPPLYANTPDTIRQTPPNSSAQWELQPTAAGSNGETLYFEYLIPVGSGITVPYYSSNPENIKIKKLEEGKINSQDVPSLTSASTESIFVLIHNDTGNPIWMQQGVYTKNPYGSTVRDIPGGEGRVYVFDKTVTSLGGFTIGDLTRKQFPATTLQPGRIYSFIYDGTSVSLISESHFDIDAQRKTWSIPTRASSGQYLYMGKQKLRRDPSKGSILLGRLQYDPDVKENTAGYFALLDGYGNVTSERMFTLIDNGKKADTIYFFDVVESASGSFIITYQAEYNIETDDDYYVKTYIMSMTSAGITRWRLCFNDAVDAVLDCEYDLNLGYIAEKDTRTFGVGGTVTKYDDFGVQYTAAFVTEVQENTTGMDASFTWENPYISNFIDYDPGIDDATVSERGCWGLVYDSALNAYISVEFYAHNRMDNGIYTILDSSDGSVIRGSGPTEFYRFGFLGINRVNDKYYVYGEYVDPNGKYSAFIIRFNENMTMDTGFQPILIPSDYGDAYFRSSTADDTKVIFGGTISTIEKFEVPWTYAIDINTGSKLWEKIYTDLDYNIVWNLEMNSIGSVQLELYDWEVTDGSLIASTDLLGGVKQQYNEAIPRNSSLKIDAPSPSIPVPSVPAGVTASAASSSSITVSWTTSSGATGYYIYRSSSATGTYTQVGSSTTTSYTNTGLSAGTTYYYKVAAYNSGGTSAQSAYVSAATALSAPVTVTAATASATSITVSWTSVTGATGYYIYRSGSATGTYTRVGSSTTASYTNTGLTSGTGYFYTVSAYNSGGESDKSPAAFAAAASFGTLSTSLVSKTIAAGAVQWYRVSVNTSYDWRVEWRDADINSSYVDITVDAWSASGVHLGYWDTDGFDSAINAYSNSINTGKNEYVYIRVQPYSPSYSGTHYMRYYSYNF